MLLKSGVEINEKASIHYDYIAFFNGCSHLEAR